MAISMKGLETYKTDKDLESSEGVWLKFPEGRRLHVLRAGGSNKAFARKFSQAIKPYRRQMDRGTMDPEKSDELMIDVYLDTVILGWEGFVDDNGNPVPYSKKVAREFLLALPEFFNDVVNFASDAATFQIEDAEETAEELGES